MIEHVDTADDPRIATYAHVADPRWLRTAGLFVAEGRLVVRRLLESGRFPVESILVTQTALDALADIATTVRNAPFPVYVCRPGALEALSGFNFHRGCLAIARRHGDETRLESFANAERLLALEAVGNPDNVGGLFRVAAALGIGGVVLDPASADPLYRKAIRTSMGATLRVPFCRTSEWPWLLQTLRDAGFLVVATTPHEDAEDLDVFAESTKKRRILVLVGAEGAGLTDAAFGLADRRVRIPIDPHGDSLNVVVAAGIVLHALAGPRRRA